jgi:hypothetical protein
MWNVGGGGGMDAGSEWEKSETKRSTGRPGQRWKCNIAVNL